jgi:hypothetical protein
MVKATHQELDMWTQGLVNKGRTEDIQANSCLTNWNNTVPVGTRIEITEVMVHYGIK